MYRADDNDTSRNSMPRLLHLHRISSFPVHSFVVFLVTINVSLNTIADYRFFGNSRNAGTWDDLSNRSLRSLFMIIFHAILSFHNFFECFVIGIRKSLIYAISRIFFCKFLSYILFYRLFECYGKLSATGNRIPTISTVQSLIDKKTSSVLTVGKRELFYSL